MGALTWTHVSAPRYQEVKQKAGLKIYPPCIVSSVKQSTGVFICKDTLKNNVFRCIKCTKISLGLVIWCDWQCSVSFWAIHYTDRFPIIVSQQGKTTPHNNTSHESCSLFLCVCVRVPVCMCDGILYMLLCTSCTLHKHLKYVVFLSLFFSVCATAFMLLHSPSIIIDVNVLQCTLSKISFLVIQFT